MRFVKQLAFVLLSFVAFIGYSKASFVEGGYEYTVTVNAYGPWDDWAAAAKQEYGSSAEVVEWNFIKSEFGGSLESLRRFLDGIGVVEFGFAPAVTWNGEQRWSGDRSYGINRAEGTVPGGYLVHDHIQNYYLLLGSWPADRQIVVRFPKTWATTYSQLATDESDIEMLRDFRDQVLLSGAEGRMLTEVLYSHSDAALTVLVNNPRLIRQANHLLVKHRGAVANVLAGEVGFISGSDEIIGFINRFSQQAPPMLQLLSAAVIDSMNKKKAEGEPFFGLYLD